MIPLTVQPASDIGLSYKSFGLTLIGGMTAAILTPLLVPVFYTLFDDAGRTPLCPESNGGWSREARLGSGQGSGI